MQATEVEGLGLEIVPIDTLREALERLLGERVASPTPRGPRHAEVVT
jgi:hypothetical protein